jgi:hypothetical protein
VIGAAPRIVGACAAAALAAISAESARAVEAPPARAAAAPPVGDRVFLRLGAGLAFVYESWSPDGPSPGSSATGWGPALVVTAGARVRPGLVIAGDLQLAGIINRTESYLGMSYDLVDTIHFVDTLGALLDWAPAKHPRLHLGVGLALAAVTDLDTDLGGVQTAYGVAIPLEAGYERAISARWAVGFTLRVTSYRVYADAPPPPSTSTGALFTFVVDFTRR